MIYITLIDSQIELSVATEEQSIIFPLVSYAEAYKVQNTVWPHTDCLQLTVTSKQDHSLTNKYSRLNSS